MWIGGGTDLLLTVLELLDLCWGVDVGSRAKAGAGGGRRGRHLLKYIFLRIYRLNKLRRQGSGQSKIADFDSTFAAYQNIGRLNISVDDIRRVNKIYAT